MICLTTTCFLKSKTGGCNHQTCDCLSKKWQSSNVEMMLSYVFLGTIFSNVGQNPHVWQNRLVKASVMLDLFPF